MKIYTYAKCDTCRKAVKWLRERGITFEEIPIREQPPTVAELGTMLEACGGDLRRLFNTSGMDYRALGIKDRLPAMTNEEAIELLSSNGNLIKRPFLLTGSSGVTGFKEAEWVALTGL
jgi:arsenate reductase (glutaredoxin)